MTSEKDVVRQNGFEVFESVTDQFLFRFIMIVQAIEAEIRNKVQNRIKDLFYQYYKVIGLNSIFLIAFSSLWFIAPVWETLIPIGMIATCYLFMIGSVMVNLWRYEKPDPTQPLPDLIRSMLSYNSRIFEQLSNFQPIILSVCSLAGMMLGLLVQSGSLDMIFYNPIGIASMLVITGTVYYLAKRGGISFLNRAFNPRYFRATKFLKEQLAELEAEGGEDVAH